MLSENILKDLQFKDSNVKNIFLKYHFFENNKLRITIKYKGEILEQEIIKATWMDEI